MLYGTLVIALGAAYALQAEPPADSSLEEAIVALDGAAHAVEMASIVAPGTPKNQRDTIEGALIAGEAALKEWNNCLRANARLFVQPNDDLRHLQSAVMTACKDRQSSYVLKQLALAELPGVRNMPRDLIVLDAIAVQEVSSDLIHDLYVIRAAAAGKVIDFSDPAWDH